jgi:hypothetical protein
LGDPLTVIALNRGMQASKATPASVIPAHSQNSIFSSDGTRPNIPRLRSVTLVLPA